MDPRVLIIIPAFNEEITIQWVVSELRRECPAYDLLVVNDASTDRTSHFARSTGCACVIDLPVNLGIGGAVQTGLKYASKYAYHCAVQFDADGQHRPEDVFKLVDMVLSDECDVAIGSRFVGDSRLHGTDLFRRMGIRFFEFLSIFLIKKRIRDHTSGFRAFSKTTIDFIMHEYPVDYP
ncbi:MAG TPA: glycosyltransferase family 2 protein, partial [Prolixibacteraceae bacterium]|nr:glycosyltransferase family 2 protein [Prolixibacteraceae bacterium]